MRCQKPSEFGSKIDHSASPMGSRRVLADGRWKALTSSCCFRKYIAINCIPPTLHADPFGGGTVHGRMVFRGSRPTNWTCLLRANGRAATRRLTKRRHTDMDLGFWE